MNKRREFLKLSGNLLAGIAIVPAACKLMPKENSNKATGLETFGLQLYCLRNHIVKDPQGILKQVASAGYKQVETYEMSNGLGLFAGMGNKAFSKLISDLGMSMPSAHTNVYQDFEKKADELGAIGVTYIIYAWEGPNKTLDDYRKMAEDFNKMGEYSKKVGMRFAFHNHEYSFKATDGIFPQDILTDRTDKNLVDFQMDHYWAVTGGQDPIVWINKHPERYKLSHFKDRVKGATERDGPAMCELGKGSIDFQNILNKTKNSAIKYYTVDQDNCNDRPDPIGCIKTDAEFMKTLIVS